MRVFVLLIFILFLSSIYALELEIDCPKSVVINEEFNCKVNVITTEGMYDLKFQIERDGKNVARIYDYRDNKWKSAYYYLKEFIGNEEKSVRLTISEIGDFQGIIKLRRGSKVNFFDFSVSVIGTPKAESLENAEVKNVEEKNDKNTETVTIVSNAQIEEREINIDKKMEPVLLNQVGLNEKVLLDKQNVVYESKNSKIMRYLPYAFCIFLIVVIVFLLWEKF
jgi:hypothetical protein